LKEIVVYQGKWSSEGKFHFHKKKDETFYILEGKLVLEFYYDTVILIPGKTCRIGPYILHKFTADTEFCKFMEVSTTHSDEDSYRVEA
jgi:uncharacterized cupin superfamily protein